MPVTDPRTLERALGLLAEPPERPDTRGGYLDLLGGGADTGVGRVQALWQSRGGSGAYDGVIRLGAAVVERLPALGGRTFFGVPDRLELTGGERVLDVGCGPGNLTRRIARAVGQDGVVLGLDASTAMLRRAVRAGGPANLLYVRADAAALPLADASVDAVASSLCLHLVPDALGTLSEMYRVLRPGGRIALAAPGASNAVQKSALDVAGRLGQARFLDPGELVEAVTGRGFTGVTDRSGVALQVVDARKPA